MRWVTSTASNMSVACAVPACLPWQPGLKSITPAATSHLLQLLHWQGILFGCFVLITWCRCSWTFWCSINIDNLFFFRLCVFPVAYLRSYVGFSASVSSHLARWSLGSTAASRANRYLGLQFLPRVNFSVSRAQPPSCVTAITPVFKHPICFLNEKLI